MAAELGKPDIEIEPETLRAIRSYSWPGNVRELRNAIERAIVLCKDRRLSPRDLPPEVRGPAAAPEIPGRGSRAPRVLDHVVKEHVLRVYGESGDNLARAARELGIGRATLRRKLRDYGITSADPARPRRA